MKHFLIVEDDILLNQTLAYNLTYDGFSITSAQNAEDAARMLNNGFRTPLSNQLYEKVMVLEGTDHITWIQSSYIRVSMPLLTEEQGVVVSQSGEELLKRFYGHTPKLGDRLTFTAFSGKSMKLKVSV